MAKDNSLLVAGLDRLPKAVSGKVKNEFNYQATVLKYFNTFYELYSTTFKWNRLPSYMYQEGADIYLENCLTINGRCLFFYDDILDKYLLYHYTGNQLNFYNYPLTFTVSNPTGYSRTGITRDQAVEIFNSPYRTAENMNIYLFAEMLAYIDNLIWLNLQSQKMPYVILCTDNQRQTMANFMAKVNSLESTVFGTKELDLDSIKILETKAEFLGLSLYELKDKYFKEALRYCGIGTTESKKERLIVNEQIDVEAEANSLLLTRLKTRQKAAEDINEKFGLDIEVTVREDLNIRMEMLTNEDYSDLMTLFRKGEGDESIHNEN